ncbi:hypothetical protein [Pseudofrankia sp. BMG5.37]|uniref:hypothetical protein n=1 Tax=Pseudofrankia sp. BMG5.37 TaxID=3050035 RepID=UPI0028957A49|nr:hypothetical protein [Pseudofrankia sp. BMG5.37]MDT3444463.1 hypothetical protein [Pseudofrankia sp. BMG5.37]
MSSPRDRPDGYALRVAVPTGWWELQRLPGDYIPNSFAATLVIDHDGNPTRVWTTSAASVSSLEETLGWICPADTRNVLLAAPATLPPRITESLDGDVPMTASHRPTRTSIVEPTGKPPTTYGRLLNTETPDRVYRDGPLHILLHTGRSHDGPVIAYRISETLPDQLPTLMFCSARHLAPGEEVDADEEIRTVVRHVLEAPSTGEATPRQVAFLARHTARLAGLAAGPPEHPYPPGTRVVVHPDIPPLRATGTILATLDDNTGYLWRPDAADLPGHPWAAHPTWALPVRREATHATLDPPDTDLSVPQPGDGTNPYQPDILATGSLVTTIDDPRFTTATVLRALDDDTHGLRYQVQPHDAPLPPQLLPADDLIPLRPAAWPTVEALVRARLAGQLPPMLDEALVTLQETGLVVDRAPDGPGIIVAAPTPWATCPLLAPDDRLTAIAASADLAPPRHPTPMNSPGTAATIHHAGDTVHIRDPIHGHLAVPTDLHTRALRQPATVLADLLARRPWIPTYPDQPHAVAAALIAQYAPAELPTTVIAHNAAPVEPDAAIPDQATPATTTPPDVTITPETPGPDLSTGPEW